MYQKIFFLFWKDQVIRQNHYIATLFEVLLPVGIVVLVNLSLPSQYVDIDKNPVSFEAYTDGKCAPSFSIYESILYEPSTPFTDILMSKAACYAGYKNSSVKSGNLSDENAHFTIGVKFDALPVDGTVIPETLNYTLLPTQKIWADMLKLWRFPGLSIPRYTNPILHTVVELQRAIDSSYLHLKNITTTRLNFVNTDLFERGIKIFPLATYFSLFMAFSLVVPCIISKIVQEKSTGAKELMLMMGTARWQLWVSKFMDVFLYLVISASVAVLFLYIPVNDSGNTLQTQPFLFWCLIIYGIIGVILFLFFLSSLFEKAILAVYVTVLIWTMSFSLSSIISSADLPAFLTYLMCLFPHVVLMQGISIILDFDYYGKSVKFTERLSGKEGSLCLFEVFCFMTVNIVLYLILTWYFERVKPGRYGIPQPYNFCFKKSYWVPRKVLISYSNGCLNNISEGFELVPNGLGIGISIKNVSKVYKTLDKGKITAVDCINLDFYHGEISALLGHNGAGKTTVFSMITGLVCPTSGQIIINGYDLEVNPSEARRSLGLCPQQDMLFKDLTTKQTLKFYGVLKGLNLKDAELETSDLITKLKLSAVKNTQAHKLSGGQKRKVSLAIALIGGSEVLVLDEPTSGMDPEIRREVWEILLGFRGTRTILLTTHFMEEADALCDRIAVMDHGKIKCYGSPMFLKSKYGKGYVLSVVVPDLGTTQDLVEYIKTFVAAARFKSQNIHTLNFELPESEINVFPALLSGLEKKQKKNEITSYCISVATLEDVFLRLRGEHEEKEDVDAIDSPSYKKLDIVEDSVEPKMSKSSFYLHQFVPLFVKKWIFFRRHYVWFLLYSLMSALMTLLLMFLPGNKIQGNKTVDLDGVKNLNYSLDLYNSLVLFSGLEKDDKKQLFSELVKSSKSDTVEVDDIEKAINEAFEDDFYTYAKKLNLGVQFSERETNISHNDEAIHMIPISLNLIHNFLLKTSLKNFSIGTTLGVGLANKEPVPVPRSSFKCRLDDLPDFSGTQTLFYLVGPVKESFYGAKGLQLMITPAPLYWLSHLIFDIASFLVYIFIICLEFKFAEADNLLFAHAGEIVSSLILWGCGLILFVYVLSLLFKNLALALSISIITYATFTFVIFNVIALEGLPKYVQYLHPSCILKFGYLDLCSGKSSHYIFALFLYDAVLFAILILNDSKLLGDVSHRLVNRLVTVNYLFKGPEDEYVKEEEAVAEKLISKDNHSGAALLVKGLKRWYFKGWRPSPAVRGISFVVNRGECFGLLGVNGAGKTSTFKMLSGNLSLSHGSAYACSQQLTFFNRRKYLKSIGYCPQSGGLIPVFTGRELLEFFARLRGVRKSCLQSEVDKWLDKMNLHEYAKQKCVTYSGGNQRKLITAVALIGDCPLIFLDEPTSGVDPLSRRAIWNVIAEIQKKGQSVVLTSHSMEECEALCSRLAIMVSGRFRCIGETPTLKNRFGQGYCVQLKLSSGVAEETVQSLKKSVDAAFESSCEMVDEHLTVLQYHVKNESLSWADLFSKLNALKENFSILESYTASATTLEQIFIYFARNQ